jgi:hypothetical protein
MESVTTFDAWGSVQTCWVSPSLSGNIKNAKYILFATEHEDEVTAQCFANFIQALTKPKSVLLVESCRKTLTLEERANDYLLNDLNIVSTKARSNLTLIGWDHHTSASEIVTEYTISQKEFLIELIKSAKTEMQATITEEGKLETQEILSKLDALITRGSEILEKDKKWLKWISSTTLLEEAFSDLSLLDELSTERKLTVLKAIFLKIRDMPKPLSPRVESLEERVILLSNELVATDFPKRTAAMVKTLRFTEERSYSGKIFLMAGACHLLETEGEMDPRWSLSSLYELLRRLPAVIVAPKHFHVRAGKLIES